MRKCLWCDDPSGDDKLCPPCRAVNDGPVFHCDKPRHDVPTLGTECAACAWEREGKRRREEVNAPIIASLVALLAQLIVEWYKPWPGAECGKAIIGMSIRNAIEELQKGKLR
jgi:hypothetical protein